MMMTKNLVVAVAPSVPVAVSPRVLETVMVDAPTIVMDSAVETAGLTASQSTRANQSEEGMCQLWHTLLLMF